MDRPELRRRLPLAMLVVCQGFVSIASLDFHLRVRPDLAGRYQSEGITPDMLAAAALGPWLLPTSAAVGALCALASLFGPCSPGLRMRLAAVGLTVSGLAFIFAVNAAMAPMWRVDHRYAHICAQRRVGTRFAVSLHVSAAAACPRGCGLSSEKRDDHSTSAAFTRERRQVTEPIQRARAG